MKDWQVVIGLEVHAQLLTQSKMFCACPVPGGAYRKVAGAEDPDVKVAPLDSPPAKAAVCPVCLGLPGALPVLNRKAVECGIRLGLALQARINPLSGFARKHYFYPDLPKGYQITQYEQPLCQGGRLAIAAPGPRLIALERIHLEEDAGKSTHDAARGLSRIDYNRAGVPLLEIVTRPELESPPEAVAFLKELRLILMYLGICSGNLEEGALRCDANVSLKRMSDAQPGTRTELKNMNSFSQIHKALDFEIERQAWLLAQGKAVAPETRLWQEGRTRSLRGKEDGRDYRYFPEPDLPPLVVDEAWIAALRADLPELPAARRARFCADYGLRPDEAAVLTQDRELADYFERALDLGAAPRAAARWIVNHVLRIMHQERVGIGQCRVTPRLLAGFLELPLASRPARQVFDAMAAGGRPAAEIVSELGLERLDDEGQIREVLCAILETHPGEVAAWRAGRTQVVHFFVGRVLQATRGRADPVVIQKMVREMLE